MLNEALKHVQNEIDILLKFASSSFVLGVRTENENKT